MMLCGECCQVHPDVAALNGGCPEQWLAWTVAALSTGRADSVFAAAPIGCWGRHIRPAHSSGVGGSTSGCRS
jgi:hypothetical protein